MCVLLVQAMNDKREEGEKLGKLVVDHVDVTNFF